MDESADIVHAFGQGGGTNLHPLVIAILAISVILIFSLKGKQIAIPFFVLTFTIPMSQVIVVGGVHFLLIRILLIIVWVKVLLVDGLNPIALNRMDKTVIFWVISSVLTYTILWAAFGALMNRLGFAFDALGIYFFFRYLLRDFDDYDAILYTQIIIALVVAVFMIIEQKTGRNLFSVFGGVPEFTAIREGKLRAQAAFAHPILAGDFGATFFPLVVSLWWSEKRNKYLIIAGGIACAIIVLASSSSGPILAFAAGIFALFLWPLRSHMRKIRWGIVLMLVSLHIAMKAPVWALIGRMSFGGGSADHRYELVNQFILRFHEWWFVGVKSTMHWGYLMHDTCQQYVDMGVRGGLITLVLFITIFVYCFKITGRIIHAYEGNPNLQKRMWAIGCACFTHLVAFFGISYFDQTVLLLYSLFAAISILNFHYLDSMAFNNQSVQLQQKEIAAS